MLAPRLQPGDEIRVIAPARSLGIIAPPTREFARKRLEDYGFRVSFGTHVEERDAFDSSSVASRVADLHAAFADPGVRGILTVIGGFSSNQLLRHLDYDLIARNPKVLCGFSDITALQNAILARTGLVTYSGPHFSSFGIVKGFDYIWEQFSRSVMTSEPFVVTPSPTWSDDPWWADQENRDFLPKPGPTGLHSGTAEGRVVGGNLCTLNLLQGTEFMPSLREAVLFVEDDAVTGAFSAVNFDRDLQSLLHLPEAGEIRGLAIGRFQKDSAMTPEKVRKIVADKPELARIPVAFDFDFGHTLPMFTIPVGGRARLTVGKSVSLEWRVH